MKFTKKIEAEVLQAYHAYWDSYLKGDMETFASLLDDDCHIIGSTTNDIFINKKDAVKFYTATAKEIKGIVEFRNRKITVLPQGENVMVQEFQDLYFLNEKNWNFYGKARISTLFSKETGSWKIIHQHGSMPDARAGEGQQLGTEKIAKENLELKEAIQRRTVELEYKNRELEIEAALERVRAVAMSMIKSEDLLGIAKVMYEELKKLGFSEIRNALIGIYKDDKDYFIDYDYSDFAGAAITNIPYNQNPTIDKTLKSLKSGSDAFTEFIVKGKELEEWKTFRKKNGEYDDTRIKDALYYYFYSIEFGDIGISTFKKISEDQLAVLKRFRNVFDLAYKRYIDITNAEAQAREAQVEAALERVRSRAIAMHTSDDILGVISTLTEQLQQLGFVMDIVNFNTDHREKDWNLWLWVSNHPEAHRLIIPYFDHPYFRWMQDAIESGIDFSTAVFTKEEKNSFQEYLYDTIIKDFPAEVRQYVLDRKGFAWSVAFFENTSVTVGNYEAQPYSEEQNAIIKRFGNAFEQSYTRFLDLQKAEAQAKEAQIQLGLERVRARTMAMQHSDDLPEAANLLFQQMRSFGMPAWSAGYCIWDNEDKSSVTLWMSSEGVLQSPFQLPTTEEELCIEMRKGSEQGRSMYVVDMGGKKLAAHYAYMRTLPGIGKMLDAIIEAGHPLPGYQIMHHAYFSKGFLLFITYEPVPDAHDIFKRFAGVFEQTYTRFLDLQKAEAQSRESQIQLALERVRARTMAMQHSDELSETATVLFEQFSALGEAPERIAIEIINEKENVFEIWATQHGGTQLNLLIKISLDEPHVMKKMYDAWKTGMKSITIDLQGQELEEYFQFLKNAGLPVQREIFGTRRVQNVAAFSKGILTIITPEPRPKETIEILERFASVFDGTYTRFLDLQKAEAQAKEAQIETALEKVRSRSLAVQKSGEFKEVIKLLFERLQELEIPMTSVSINVFISDSKDTQVYICGPGEDGLMITEFRLFHFDHPISNDRYKAHEKGLEFFTRTYSAEEKNSYYKYVFEKTDLKHLPKDIRKMVMDSGRYTISLALTKNSMIVVNDFEGKSLKPSKVEIVKKFARIFEQTYTRFLDLQKAEGQAREAQIEASLERVRSKAMSMQKSEDLAAAITIVFEELDKLNLGMLRCGIGILNREKRTADVWTTTISDNNSVVQVSGDESMDIHPLLSGAFNAWLNQTEHEYILKGEDLRNYYKAVAAANFKLPDSQSLVTGEKEITQYYYNAVWASGGLFAFTETPFTEEAKTILKRFADVFTLTYTRFNDLKIAEAHARKAEQDVIEIKAARQKAEEALTELQATQKQLVQSEKMASLGELTAGIAHEIQNPLNFVNNFSEVSNELLDEMIEEIKKGNYEEAEALVNDVKQNLEKINNHGKRADGIVKGMLQHSRTGSGQKELTDINVLCDEYLRLAYHGLRAKDKNFNAKFETDFDKTIEKINVIPQEIGRVVLNLITNAFYVVSEKRKQSIAGYEPVVSVATKKMADKIEVRIKDNGSGIPSHILDKIFQPFFTTKPTGQGTGLGLSLSYDIVKAHGGELKVYTKEGEGSEFSIELPVG